jgi:outer membrane protein assembly factor BamB
MNRWFGIVLVWLLCGPASSFAAVVSGTIETVTPGDGQIVVRVGKQGALKTYKLSPTAQVMLQGKKAELDQLEAGLAVTVTTDSKGELATKVVARQPVAAKPDAPAAAPKARNTKKVAAKSVAAVEVALGDWPQYRGPQRDLTTSETGLLDRWPADGPALAWQTEGLGEGYSSVAVVGDTIFTQGSQGREERLFALARDGGEKKWSIPTGSFRNDGMGGGPRGTPTVDGDRVYALGANGDLVCAKVDDGEVVWQMNILKEFEGNNIAWGISESVLIDGDRLICTPGGKQATMVALDKLTGKPIWRSVVPGAPSAGYSSAIAVEVGGVRQYVNVVHTAVVGVRASDGNPLWGQRESTNGTANCSSPLFIENHIFTASGYGTGCALFKLASGGGQTRSEVVFSSKQMQNHHGGMIALDGYVYGFDEAILTCLDLKTGKPAWQNRSVGKGSLAFAEGKLYLRSENGPLALAEATPKGYEELGRFEQPDRGDRPAWAHPVVAGGKLYLRDQDKLLVYNVKK